MSWSEVKRVTCKEVKRSYEWKLISGCGTTCDINSEIVRWNETCIARELRSNGTTCEINSEIVRWNETCIAREPRSSGTTCEINSEIVRWNETRIAREPIKSWYNVWNEQWYSEVKWANETCTAREPRSSHE